MTGMLLPIVVIAVGSALMAFSSCVAANICIFMMVEKVNQVLPREKQYEQMWWNTGKLSRVCSDYKRLHPQGRLSRYMVVLIVLMGISLITTLVLLVAISPNTTAR
jgi:hypothetical protein